MYPNAWTVGRVPCPLISSLPCHNVRRYKQGCVPHCLHQSPDEGVNVWKCLRYPKAWKVWQIPSPVMMLWITNRAVFYTASINQIPDEWVIVCRCVGFPRAWKVWWIPCPVMTLWNTNRAVLCITSTSSLMSEWMSVDVSGTLMLANILTSSLPRGKFYVLWWCHRIQTGLCSSLPQPVPWWVSECV